MASTSSQSLITPQKLFSRNHRQLEAWNESLAHRFLLYGGAAGGGKSFFLRWWCAFYLLWLNKEGMPGAQVMLACEDYPSLLDRQISKIRYEFPLGLGELKEGTTRDFVLRDEYGGGRILLRNLDDPSKYLSAEFAGIGVDELTRNERSVFDFLRSRLRWPGVANPRFVGTTNPGGRGHKWVKALWVDNPPELPPELEPLRHEFKFVPAMATDNPFLPEQYFRDLKTLPPAMAKAYAEGSWDQFVGQYFDQFRASMCPRVEDIGMRDWWPRWISIDWGYQHPSAAYWHTSNEDIVRTYREFVQNQLTPEKLAEVIVERSGEETITDVYLSPDAFAKRTGEATIAEQIGEVFSRSGLPFPTRANDDRIGGWMYMYQQLGNGGWVIADNCTELIRCLPTLVRDDIKVEDIAKMDGDDPADAARYGLYSPVGSRRPPLTERVDARIDSFVQARGGKELEPTSYALMVRRATNIEKKSEWRGRPKRWRPQFHQ